MKHTIKNDKGQIIDGKKKLSRAEYGTGEVYPNGEPVVNWTLLSKFADKDGFDTRNIVEGGKYKIEVELPRGTIVIRYGNEVGRFSAPKGVKYEDLALPYVKATVEYNEYRVIAKSIKVSCVVEKGIVAPGFGSKGGVVQYMHPISIRESIRTKLLERVSI